MIFVPQNPDIEQFKQKLCDSLMREMLAYPTIKVSKNSTIYAIGDENDKVYFVESGQILKILTPSSKSKEYVISIRSQGDMFNESCIGYSGKHSKTAIAITDTCLKTISSTEFLTYLSKESLLQDFIQYLVIQAAHHHQIIANIISFHNNYVS